jgi:hypothetical protein
MRIPRKKPPLSQGSSAVPAGRSSLCSDAQMTVKENRG